MHNKSIVSGLYPLVWGALIALAIALALYNAHSTPEPIPVDAIYVRSGQEVAL